MSILDIPTARVFAPLLQRSRYKAVKGGRGSGKSHFLAGLLIEDCASAPGETAGEGMRAVCLREVQQDLAQSSKALIEDKLRGLGLSTGQGFKVWKDRIETPGDGLIIFKGMNDFNADSIKSLEGFKRSWWEEAHGATMHSMNMLRPTLRADGAERWFSWNPRRASDAIELMFGAEKPTGTIAVTANWRDNPWFTADLELERQDCLRMQPEQYDHIWGGGYVSVVEGAYYAKWLAKAKAEGRIGRVAADPLMQLRAFCDLGGTGAKADAFAMWIAQFIGKEIRVLDYYEAQGQPLATHLEWMRGRGYTPKRVNITLPHDGATNERITDNSFEAAFQQAGYSVEVIPNQGAGAAKMRIEAGRRLFPSIWFNRRDVPDETLPDAAGGLDALGWYHEKKDAHRGIGLGPDHDWSSHGSDAFGLMCVAYEAPKGKPKAIAYPKNSGVI